MQVVVYILIIILSIETKCEIYTDAGKYIRIGKIYTEWENTAVYTEWEILQ